jgi:ubiquitin carboxyl-terminal hydrolase L3
MEGDTKPPARAEDEVDYHYVAFASSHKSGKVYELDAALKGPIDTGIVLDEKEDMLSEKVFKIVKGYFDRENKPGGDIGFGLLALVPRGST